MDAPWRIELFGGLRATRGTHTVRRFRLQKAGALLAYLAYYSHRSHPRDTLVEILWPGCEWDAGRNRLSVALSSLRRQLEPPGVPAGAVLLTDHATVQLNPAALTTDVAQFEALLQAAARVENLRERVAGLREAAELYQGELLPGYFDDWVLPERERLAGAWLQAISGLIDLLERAGDLPQAVEWARREVAVDPLREEGHGDLIRLLAASGQPEEARRQYRELERILAEQLGEDPSPEIQALVSSLGSQLGRARGPAPTGSGGQHPSAASPALGVPRVPGPLLSGEASARKGGARPDRSSSVLVPAEHRAPGTAHRERREHPDHRLPTGTVTFLWTDIESSTALWERTGDAFREALAQHQELLRQVMREHGGCEVKDLGDGFLIAFPRAANALACAVAGQRALAGHVWPEVVGALRVRLALHTGDVAPEAGDYHGLVLHHGQRVLTAGHGGQILCTEATAALVRRELPAGVRLADLGIYRLRDVASPERLFQVEYPEMARREFPPLRAEAGHASHLPLQFTRLFGRENELELLAKRLRSPERRLVTLMGPAGTGKTRLALAVAEQLVEAWQGAVYFVPLADLTDPQRIVDAIRDAMRLPRSADGDRSEATSGAAQVVEALARHPALLVLDNFEHLVEAGAPVVQRLLERLPTLTILVTSRQRLNLAGEQEFLVPPLPPPPESIRPEELVRCPSVQLFVDRAQAVRPDFQVTAGTAAAVAALCQRLEGIPLALELAAARAGVLTPAQMVARLEQRFELLAQRRSVDARHQSLRAALDWSYQLLPAAMQRFFAALSLFRGGFTLAAAEAVCRAGEGRSSGAALDDVTELRECSLVDVVEVGDAARYRLLETLREYGAERLQEEPERARAAADRHAQYYLAFAEERAARMRTREEARALTELGEELDNLRAGMDWAQASEQGELCARLALALYPALHGRGFWEEARSRLQVGRVAVEDQEGDARGSLAAIHCHLAGLAQDMGDLAEARRQAEASLGLHRELNDAQGTAEALNVLGLLGRDEGDVEAARRCFDDALTLLTDADHARRGMVLNNLASLAFRLGVVEEARQLYQQSLTLLRAAGDLRHEVTTLNNLGFLAHQYDADRAEARRLYQESLALCRELRNDQGVAVMLNNLGELAEVEGDVPTAVGLLVHAERIFRDARSAHVAVPAASLDRLRRQLGAEPFAALRAEAEQAAWEELVERT